MENLRNLWRPKYPSLNYLEILANNLLDNLQYLQSLKPGAEMIPVLKANAYGHGLKEVAKILNQAKLKRVAVDSFPEVQIVNRYFKGRALIIGEMPGEAYNYLDWNRAEVVVYNLDTLKKIAKFGKSARVHLFFNSGMNREGVKDLGDFLSAGKKYLDQVNLIGFCSHLASAEESEEFNNQQIKSFNLAHDLLKSFGFRPELIHLGNSAAVFSLDNKNLNAYRVGLSFYGYHLFSDQSSFKEMADNNLKPALRVISKIVNISDLEPGETVSYNRQFVAENKCRIITVPFGYYEGLDWNLSNSYLKAKINNRSEDIYLELVGRVSMNLSNWRLLGNHSLELGEQLVILSAEKNQANCLANLAKLSAKLPYELLIRLRSNIRRIVKY